eukprot:2377438-Rhodomonas_salina.4
MRRECAAASAVCTLQSLLHTTTRATAQKRAPTALCAPGTQHTTHNTAHQHPSAQPNTLPLLSPHRTPRTMSGADNVLDRSEGHRVPATFAMSRSVFPLARADRARAAVTAAPVGARPEKRRAFTQDQKVPRAETAGHEGHASDLAQGASSLAAHRVAVAGALWS